MLRGTLIAEKSEGVSDHARSRLEDLTPEPHKYRVEKNNIPFYGGCFEYWTGILLALGNPEAVLNRTRVRSWEGHRPSVVEADFFVSDNTSLFGEPIFLVEVKSGGNPRRRNQEIKYAKAGLPVVYVVSNKRKEVADNLRRKDHVLDALLIKDFPTRAFVKGTNLDDILMNPRRFKKYVQKKCPRNLERNIYSVFRSLSFMDSVPLEGVHIALDAAYYNDSELMRETQKYGFRWLDAKQFKRESRPRKAEDKDALIECYGHL